MARPLDFFHPTMVLAIIFAILSLSDQTDDIDNPSGASVNILNSEAEPILVHCQSKDSDLGARPVIPGSNYYWQFHPNIFGMTLYFCEFFWKAKSQSFQVWKGSYYDNRPACSELGHCTYKVASDGFYYALEKSDDNSSAADATQAWQFYEPWLPLPPV